MGAGVVMGGKCSINLVNSCMCSTSRKREGKIQAGKGSGEQDSIAGKSLVGEEHFRDDLLTRQSDKLIKILKKIPIRLCNQVKVLIMSFLLKFS